MTEKPLGGPEPDDLFSQAQAHVQVLHKLTQDIQLQTKFPDLPTLNQLVLQRDETIRALNLMDLQSLSQAQQTQLAEAITACQAMDPQIEAWLAQTRNRLERQVRGLQSGQQLIDKYKLNTPETGGQHSQDA
jgi:hypothetical protein